MGSVHSQHVLSKSVQIKTLQNIRSIVCDQRFDKMRANLSTRSTLINLIDILYDNQNKYQLSFKEKVKIMLLEEGGLDILIQCYPHLLYELQKIVTQIILALIPFAKEDNSNFLSSLVVRLKSPQVIDESLLSVDDTLSIIETILKKNLILSKILIEKFHLHIVCLQMFGYREATIALGAYTLFKLMIQSKSIALILSESLLSVYEDIERHMVLFDKVTDDHFLEKRFTLDILNLCFQNKTFFGFYTKFLSSSFNLIRIMRAMQSSQNSIRMGASGVFIMFVVFSRTKVEEEKDSDLSKLRALLVKNRVVAKSFFTSIYETSVNYALDRPFYWNFIQEFCEQFDKLYPN